LGRFRKVIARKSCTAGRIKKAARGISCGNHLEISEW
jgi:hypothetical protein